MTERKAATSKDAAATDPRLARMQSKMDECIREAFGEFIDDCRRQVEAVDLREQTKSDLADVVKMLGRRQQKSNG